VLLRPLGATARLSTANAVRNPVRTALTTGVLMLAVGIIVTLQVGTATTRQTVMDRISEEYPVDLSATAPAVSYDVNTGQPKPAGSVELPDSVVSDFAKLPNLKAKASLSGAPMKISDSPDQTLVLGADPSQLEPVTSATAAQLQAGRILMNINAGFKTGDHVDVKGDRGTVNLTVQVSRALDDPSVAMVSASDLTRLTSSPKTAAIWASMTDRTDMAETLSSLTSMQQQHPEVQIGGGALYAAIIEQILKVLLIVMTTLFGVAVVIALIGVANTLGLSVLERRRESALLRAMGMQRGSLRLMLFYEAIQMVMAGVIVGVIAGGFFAWLGIKSVFKMSGIPMDVKFAVDWPTTIGLVLICFVAASLASIVPGRRAAKATPTEALAEE
jgi:putative ABC transport system permease protein